MPSLDTKFIYEQHSALVKVFGGTQCRKQLIDSRWENDARTGICIFLRFLFRKTLSLYSLINSLKHEISYNSVLYSSYKTDNVLLEHCNVVFELNVLYIFLQNIGIENNSLAYDVWVKPPIYPLMGIYVFNYTNADEYLEGKDVKLKVEEVGPFVYR